MSRTIRATSTSPRTNQRNPRTRDQRAADQRAALVEYADLTDIGRAFSGIVL